MSEVSLSIGGRSYKVACADGEEAHVTRLGEAIDAKLAAMPQLSAQDTQNLLFGALLLADELHELRNAQTAAVGEADTARAEADRHKSDAAEARREVERLAAKLAETESSRDAIGGLRAEIEELRQAEADMGAELHAAQAAEAELREQLAALQSECDDLRGQLDAAQAAPAPAAIDDPALGPALERFADLLESCADKLEGRASAT